MKLQIRNNFIIKLNLFDRSEIIFLILILFN